MDPKKSIDSNATNDMFSVVERINAGYDKFFDSKPKISGIRSECYSNYKTCGSTSINNLPKRCAGITGASTGIKSEKDSQNPSDNRSQNVMQEFFTSADEPIQCPGVDETKQCQRINNGSGYCKYLSEK